MTKQTMPETMYRASRCCRILGNPTAYLILRCLGAKRKTPGDISQELKWLCDFYGIEYVNPDEA